MKFYEHPLIKSNSLEAREYQVEISKKVIDRKENTLIVLPTGVGKTEIAILIIAEILHSMGPKILFLAPTRPLVLQHRDRISKYILDDKIVALTGTLPPEKRISLWNENDIIVSTPQVIQNDILSGGIDPNQVKLLIVDEAHRSVGKYAYTFVTEQCKNSLIIGLTASPGSKMERIQEIMSHLNIKNVEIRTEMDEDVRPYIHGIKIENIMLNFPDEYEPLREKLNEIVEALKEDIKQKYPDINLPNRLTKKKVLEFQKEISAKIESGNKSLFEALSLFSMVLKILIALEYLETQGLKTCHEYLEQLVHQARIENAKRTDIRLNKLRGFQEAVLIARELIKLDVKSPKIMEIEKLVLDQLKKNSKSKIIIFTNYRNINMEIYEDLIRFPEIRASRFLGQNSRGTDRGMSQAEQEEILKRFRNGEINVLISTQIGEEGLDIPETDLVIFHEPVSSEIRNIQRRGRTGRARPGRVVVLVYKDTIDEILFYAGIKKEKKMKERMSMIANKPKKKKGQATLFDF